MTKQIESITHEIPADIASQYKDDALVIAHDCLLLERCAGKSYQYTAVNLKTGNTTPISRRKNQLRLSGLPRIAEKIRLSAQAESVDCNIEMEPGSNLFHGRLEEVLRTILREFLPQHGYAVRDAQAELASHILTAISRRAVSLAEAEVGTGKTLAYLLAAVLAKRGRVNDFWLRGHDCRHGYGDSAYMPVVLSTSSIALQNAIVNDYIPALSQILLEHCVISTPLTCIIRKGKEHFLCERRLLAYFKDVDAATRKSLEPLLKPSDLTDLGDAEGISAYDRRRIGVSGCCDEDCKRFGRCRYSRYMQRAQSNRIDFQVCNHNYFLADLMRRSKDQLPLLPNYQTVIVDEGHKFIGAARQMYGIELSSKRIPQLVTDIRSFTYPRGVSDKGIEDLAVKLAGQNKRLFDALHKGIPSAVDCDDADRYPAAMDKAALRHLWNIHVISNDLVQMLSNRDVQPYYTGRYKQAIRTLRDIGAQADALHHSAELICWLENPGEDAVLSATPKRLGEKLRRDLWSGKIPVVLSSGTLSAAGDFTHTRRTLGLDRLPAHRLMETSKPSPFPYRQNTLLYISETVPFPDPKAKKYINAVADETEALLRASHGHGAVLFTSYKVMDMVWNMLQCRDLPFPMFRLNRGDSGVIDHFRESRNSALFASGAMWEGIDLPGDILSMLIIVKLPFPVPDPISEYERTRCTDMEAYKTSVIVPEMLMKLKQGFGRLIRTETDTGVVALLDSRIRPGNAYREPVLKALPDCCVTSSIKDINAFMRQKKSAEYFREEATYEQYA